MNRKCEKCGAEWKIDAVRSSSIKLCPFCHESLETEKTSEWQFFDNTKELLAFIVSEYGDDALFGKKHFSDHSAPLMPTSQKNLVKQAYECGAVKIIQDNVSSDQSRRETAVKQAVGRLIDNYGTSEERAKKVIWEFTNAIGWGMPEPQTQSVPQNTSPNELDANCISTAKSSSDYSRATATLGKIETGISSQKAKISEYRQFEQKSKKSGGYVLNGDLLMVNPTVGKIFHFGGIDWRVLAVENNKALLISKKVLETRPYNVKQEKITWETCTIREYLNNEFYNKLGGEKLAIAKTRNNNPDNSWYGIAGGNATTDMVFLLSLEEVCRYFGDSTANLKKGKGATGSDYYIRDGNNNARIAKGSDGKACWWWLRSPGINSYHAAHVHDDGRVDILGNFVSTESGGVRPALWLNL